MIFDARSLALGWQAVAIAAGQDEARPILYRTVLVEEFPDGVRLVSTDGVMLLRAWVPTIKDNLAPEPDLDEVPAVSAVAMDPHKRALSLCSHLLALTSGEDPPPIEVQLSLGIIDSDPTAPPAFEGMEASWIVIEQLGAERLMLQTMDAGYPSWRNIGHAAKAARLTGLTADVLTRLAKLAKLIGVGACPIAFEFAGDKGSIAISAVHSNAQVVGTVMPYSVS